MAFGITPKDSSGIPIGTVYVPNHAGSNLTALQGGLPTTDANGNESAPVAVTQVTLLAGEDQTNNAMYVEPQGTSFTLTSTSQQTIGLTNIAKYKSISVQITSIGTNGTLTAQISNDNSNFVNKLLNSSFGVPTTTPAVTGVFEAGINANYIQFVIGGISAGTFTAQVFISTLPYSPTSQAITICDGGGAARGATLNSDNSLNVRVGGGAVFLTPASLSDATANPSVGSSGVLSSLYNNTTWDRQRGNVDLGAVITAVTVSTTQASADLVNYNGRGAKFTLDLTALTSGGVNILVDYKDTASGKYTAILTGANITSISTNIYTIYPGIAAVANLQIADVLPRTFRVRVFSNSAVGATYTVGSSVIN